MLDGILLSEKGLEDVLGLRRHISSWCLRSD